ncbi:MAG: response regulator [Dokdonella sp.]|uniref:response regulator n=1 Tax=Dokdonella sp. TaxID=2291710 RepID=UPI003265AF6A
MRCTALLIEDNDQNRYLATFLLEHAGYTVVSAADGPSGLAIALKHLPDVILLDIQLPLMDGYAVARALRTTPSFASVPIIAITSYAMSGDREKAFECGFTAYIEKPIDPQAFIDQLLPYRAARHPAKESP